MTDHESLTQMLTDAQVPFEEGVVRWGKEPHITVEVDSGNGAIAVFHFHLNGFLMKFNVDKDAY